MLSFSVQFILWSIRNALFTCSCVKFPSTWRNCCCLAELLYMNCQHWLSCCTVFSWADYLLGSIYTGFHLVCSERSSNDSDVIQLARSGGEGHSYVLRYLNGQKTLFILVWVLYYSSGKSICVVWYLIFLECVCRCMCFKSALTLWNFEMLSISLDKVTN